MVTDKVIHLHVMKTAGQRLRGILREIGCKVICDKTHMPLAACRKYGDQPAFTVVRDPFAWYESRWAYRHALTDVKKCQADAVSFTEHMDIIIANNRKAMKGRTYARTTLTGWHTTICGGLRPEGVHIARFEHLADDLALWLAKRTGVNEQDIRERLAKPSNTSKHEKLVWYARHIDWVWQNDETYMQEFGYA